MQRLKRILKWLAIGGVALTVVAYAILHIGSERILRRSHEAPLSAFVAPSDPALLAEGERMSRIRGCNGCHGARLQGAVVIDHPWMGRAVAGNLTRVAQDHSDAELERVIRRGVRRNGHSVWMMPSPMFAHLSDEDLGSIIAYLRSVPPSDGPASAIELRLLGRIVVLLGELPPLVEEVDMSATPRAPDRDDPLDLGRYLAMTSCSECHGEKLLGDGQGSPPLSIAAAYTQDAFAALMRDGVALGDRQLPMMSGVARNRFSHLTDAEVGALHVYLSGLAAGGE
jgi:cytochrome c553